MKHSAFSHETSWLFRKRLMKEIEKHWFELLDEYTRRRHNCFLAEFFREQQGPGYTLCFRPARLNLKSEQRYVCRYVHLGADDVVAVGTANGLPLAVSEKVDQKLRELAVSLDG